MMEIEEFTEIKAKIERKKIELERKKGELETLLKMLKEEFGCGSLEEAEALLAKLKEQEEVLRNRLEAKAGQLEQAWKEYKEKVDGQERNAN